MKLKIIPFNKFWLNCNFNSNFSILTSINKSYEDLALLNCYSYCKSPQEWCPKNIALNQGNTHQRIIINNIITTEKILFN